MIIFKEMPYFDRKYVAFGKLVFGYNLLNDIEKIPTLHEVPINKIKIVDTGIWRSSDNQSVPEYEEFKEVMKPEVLKDWFIHTNREIKLIDAATHEEFYKTHKMGSYAEDKNKTVSMEKISPSTSSKNLQQNLTKKESENGTSTENTTPDRSAISSSITDTSLKSRTSLTSPTTDKIEEKPDEQSTNPVPTSPPKTSSSTSSDKSENDKHDEEGDNKDGNNEESGNVDDSIKDSGNEEVNKEDDGNLDSNADDDKEEVNKDDSGKEDGSQPLENNDGLNDDNIGDNDDESKSTKSKLNSNENIDIDSQSLTGDDNDLKNTEEPFVENGQEVTNSTE